MEGKMNASLTRSCRSTPSLFPKAATSPRYTEYKFFSKCLSPYTFLKKMVFSNKAKTAPSLFALSRRSMQPWTDSGGRGNPKMFCFSTWLPRPPPPVQLQHLEVFFDLLFVFWRSRGLHWVLSYAISRTTRRNPRCWNCLNVFLFS